MAEQCDDPSILDQPIETNYELCIKCQVPGGDLVKNPTSHDKLLLCIQNHALYGTKGFYGISKRLGNITAEEMKLKGATWHRSCFQDTVHAEKLKRAKNRYEKAVARGDTSLLTDVQKGRPFVDYTSTETPVYGPKDSIPNKRFTRSLASPYTKDVCLFCNTDDSKEALHEVTSFNVGEKIHDAVQKSNNDEWKIRLQPLDSKDARAIDIKYHLSCYVRYVQRRESHASPVVSNSNDVQTITADIEFYSLVEKALKDGQVIEMNNVSETYKAILESNGITDFPSRRQLKQNISDNISNVQFSQPRKNKLEVLSSKSTKDKALGDIIDNADLKKNMKSIFDAARVIRNDILQMRKDPWKFEGKLDSKNRSQHIPDTLHNLLKWITQGTPDSLGSQYRTEANDKACMNLAELIMYQVKSQRQVSFVPQHPGSGFHYSTPDLPILLGTGMKVHAYTRSKHMVDYLHACGLSVDYSRILSIESQLAQAIIKGMKKTGGVIVPPGVDLRKPVYFAIDNADFQEDTPDGRRTTHGTILVLFQPESENYCTTEPESDMLRTCEELSEQLPDSITEMVPCSLKGAPVPHQSEKYEAFKPLNNEPFLKKTHLQDTAWLISRSLNRTHDSVASEQELSTEIPTSTISVAGTKVTKKIRQVPNWAAYNSFVCDDDRPKSYIYTYPLIAAPANEWQTLLSVLKQAQDINTQVVGEDRKTIITLDMDLYMRALKLQEMEPGCKGKWILRIGEFHTVLCAIRAIGAFIENTGIDDAWVESGIYGTATARQIIEGKHMKRSVTAHLITLQVLFDLFFKVFQCDMDTHQLEIISKSLEEACENRDKAQIKAIHNELICTIEESEIEEKMTVYAKEKCASLPNFNVAWTYMEMVASLQQFIRASREGLWLLHLASLEKLCPYFFIQNRLKYAQHVPEYIARMYSLKESDPEIWEFFMNGNFCVKKSKTPFTSIGVDHALEQENRRLKVLGGIRGITLKPTTLMRFFLVSPELSRLSKEAEEMVNLTGSTQRSHHHELSTTSLTLQENKILQLQEVIAEENPFKSERKEMINFVTKSVMSDDVMRDVMRASDFGLEAYKAFVAERIIGNENLWKKMTKTKLLMCSSAGKKLKVKTPDRIVQLREDRSLMIRMALVARSRPDINMEEAISMYEFSCIPRSLFASDGSVLPSQDKSKLIHILQDLPNEHRETSSSAQDNDHILIIDAMIIVQELAGRKDNIKSCLDLSGAFNACVERIMSGYDTVHCVFDQYNKPTSLKETTRERRKGVTVQPSYACKDSTPIRTSLKIFLSESKTKDSLTLYLARKALDHFKSSPVTLIISTRDGVTTNRADRKVSHLHTNQEEADTILILHAIDEAVLNAQATIHILSTDTDVLVLALAYFHKLGANPCLLTGHGKSRELIALRPIYDALGHSLARALLGFHSFTGCDTIGRFSGKGKITCWKTFWKADKNIVQGFQALGQSEIPSEDTIAALECYVCQLYLPGTKMKYIGNVRWLLFKKNQAECEKLPPTKGALHQHILRANYQARIWNMAHIAHPELPLPTEHGWEMENNHLIPVRTLLKPAPDAVIELVHCKCLRSRCQNAMCSCRKAGFICTEMCQCGSGDDDCDNTEVTTVLDDDDEEDI